MVHMFIQNGFRMALDSGSGKILVLTELSYKILEYLKPPVAPRCPINLRYNLAKFPANDVEKAYSELYQLYQAGVLFAKDTEETAPWMFYDGPKSFSFIKHIRVKEQRVSGATTASVVISREDLSLCERVLRLADDGAGRIVCEFAGSGEEGACVIEKADVPVLCREYDKLTTELIRRDRDGNPFIFAGFEIADGQGNAGEACGTCWAKHSCALSCPNATACPLERKRLECAIALKAATAE